MYLYFVKKIIEKLIIDYNATNKRIEAELYKVEIEKKN